MKVQTNYVYNNLLMTTTIFFQLPQQIQPKVIERIIFLVRV